MSMLEKESLVLKINEGKILAALKDCPLKFLSRKLRLNLVISEEVKGGSDHFFFFVVLEEKIITNSYFIIFFMFICQNVGNFKGFLLVGLY